MNKLNQFEAKTCVFPWYDVCTFCELATEIPENRLIGCIKKWELVRKLFFDFCYLDSVGPEVAWHNHDSSFCRWRKVQSSSKHNRGEGESETQVQSGGSFIMPALDLAGGESETHGSSIM